MEYHSLPEKHHIAHETCWSLVELIEDIILNQKFDGLRIQVFREVDLEPGEHPLDALLRKGLVKEHNNFVKKQILNGLLKDICYFMQEALGCSAKRRLTVTMALIRKPFLYNLLVILRLTFDADFIKNFNEVEDYDPTSMTAEDKKTLINLSMKVLMFSKSLTEEQIFDYIFSKEGDSISNMSDKALHLTTTRKTNRSGMQNFNYVFTTQENIEGLWNYLYQRLPTLLLYLNEVVDFTLSTCLEVDTSIRKERILKRGEIITRYVENNE